MHNSCTNEEFLQCGGRLIAFISRMSVRWQLYRIPSLYIYDLALTCARIDDSMRRKPFDSLSNLTPSLSRSVSLVWMRSA